MVIQSFNHIQRENGSYWSRLMRSAEGDHYCIVAVGAAKYVNAAGYERGNESFPRQQRRTAPSLRTNLVL